MSSACEDSSCRVCHVVRPPARLSSVKGQCFSTESTDKLGQVSRQRAAPMQDNRLFRFFVARPQTAALAGFDLHCSLMSFSATFLHEIQNIEKILHTIHSCPPLGCRLRSRHSSPAGSGIPQADIIRVRTHARNFPLNTFL